MANTYQSINMDATGGTDNKDVKISIDDTTAGFLEDKIVAGSNKVTVTTLNPGADEDLEIDVDESNIDHNNLTNYSVDEHRTINDAGSAATDLWSAQKIQAELDAQNEASEIVYDPSGNAETTAVNVQDGLDDTASQVTQNASDISNHIADATDAHAASAITNTPAGNIAATNIQGAVNELDTEKYNAADFDGDFDTRLGTKDTADLTEGTNLYYTEGRVSANTSVAANTAKVSADGSVTTHSDVTDAGSGAIITTAERTKVGHISVTQAVDLDTIESDTATNNAKVSADGSVATHSDVTDAGSGAIITGAERTTLGTALQPADASTNLNHTQADTGDWTVADGASVGAHLDEVGDRLNTIETANTPVASTGDLDEGSFAGAADTASNLAVTNFLFANGVVRSFSAHVSVIVDANTNLYEEFDIKGIQKGADWEISVASDGDDSLVTFDITAAGQVTYSKATTSGWNSTTIKYRAITTSV